MASSPDARPYVDLTLYDVDPDEIAERGVEDASLKFPDWVPQEGNTEVVLIESLALEVAELVYAINRVPGAVVETLLRLFDVEPDEGAPPSATATFAMTDTLGYTIPVGTRLSVAVGGDEPLLLLTENSLVIPPGDSTGTVDVVGVETTVRGNGIPAGTPLELIDSVAYVDSVELATDVADGSNPESSEAYFERGVQVLSRLVSTLVLPIHFERAALAEPDVQRARAVDLYDASLGSGSPGDHAGHVTVAVLGGGGATLSTARKAELDEDFEAQALVNLEVHVVDPDLQPVDVTSVVTAEAGHDLATVEANVEAAISDLLDPSAWPWAAVVRVNEVIALLDRVVGVDYVESVLLDGAASDVALSGIAPLATTGTLTTTVNAP